MLEEGVGHVEMMVVAYKLPDGRILIGAGPVMSHYEFRACLKIQPDLTIGIGLHI